MDMAESKFENRDGDVPEFRSAYTDKQLQLLRRCRAFVESITICVIIGSVWALLSLPTVFYFLNPDSQQVSAGQVSCGYGKVRGLGTVKMCIIRMLYRIDFDEWHAAALEITTVLQLQGHSID